MTFVGLNWEYFVKAFTISQHNGFSILRVVDGGRDLVYLKAFSANYQHNLLNYPLYFFKAMSSIDKSFVFILIILIWSPVLAIFLRGCLIFLGSLINGPFQQKEKKTVNEICIGNCIFETLFLIFQWIFKYFNRHFTKFDDRLSS